jgi:hypothetical protein
MSMKSSCSAVTVTVSASGNTNAVSPMGTGDTRAGVWLMRMTASCIRGHSSIALHTVRAISATPSGCRRTAAMESAANSSGQQCAAGKSNSENPGPCGQGRAGGFGDACKTIARLRRHACAGADVLQICIDIRIVRRQQCGTLIVEHCQSRLAGARVRVSQVVKAICRVPRLRWLRETLPAPQRETHDQHRYPWRAHSVPLARELAANQPEPALKISADPARNPNTSLRRRARTAVRCPRQPCPTAP